MAIIHDPRKIEARSFEIIDGFLRGAGFPKPRKDIIRRVIHTTVDRSYAKDLIFSKNAIESALKALKSGALIIVSKVPISFSRAMDIPVSMTAIRAITMVITPGTMKYEVSSVGL